MEYHLRRIRPRVNLCGAGGQVGGPSSDRDMSLVSCFFIKTSSFDSSGSHGYCFSVKESKEEVIFLKYFFRLLLNCGKCRKPALNQGFSKARGSSFKQKRPTFSRNKDQVKTRTEARFQKARGRGTFPPASYPTPCRASKRRNSHGDKAASHHQPHGGELHGA